MCSSNVHKWICIYQEKGFSQRMTSNKAHKSVQITKSNHNNQQARGSSSHGLQLVPKEEARLDRSLCPVKVEKNTLTKDIKANQLVAIKINSMKVPLFCTEDSYFT